MARARAKAIYIGVPAVGDALQKLRPDWDFLPHVSNIEEFWQGLVSETISNDIQVILLLDQFFDPSGQDNGFEKLVAAMGPHCLFGIVNYSPGNREHMREKIDMEAFALGDTTSLRYYFIDPKKPGVTIEAAVSDYVSNGGNDEVAAILSGATSAEQRQAVIDERAAAHTSPDAADEEDSPYLGKVVACTSSKGGSGKSTVAITLATYLAHASVNSVREGREERALKVIIVDLDVRDGQLGFVTGNSKPTVIQLRLNGISRENIESTIIHSPRLKLDLLLAPKRPRNSDDTPPEFYVELIQNLRKMYDYVILDTSVNYLDPLLEKVAYPMADQIVYVTDIVVSSVFSMTRWIQEVTKPKDQNGMGISKNKIGIVVNKSLLNINMPGEKIARSALGLPVITAIPSNPRLIAHATNMQSLEMLIKHKDLYPRFRRLARAIVGKNYDLSDNVEA